jgi:hypothetical protein
MPKMQEVHEVAAWVKLQPGFSYGDFINQVEYMNCLMCFLN